MLSLGVRGLGFRGLGVWVLGLAFRVLLQMHVLCFLGWVGGGGRGVRL